MDTYSYAMTIKVLHLMNEYWGKINVRVNLIFGVKFDAEPQCLLSACQVPVLKALIQEVCFIFLHNGQEHAQIN